MSDTYIGKEDDERIMKVVEEMESISETYEMGIENFFGICLDSLTGVGVFGEG